MIKEIEQFKQIRQFVVKLISDFTESELLKIPEKFNNNIWWNVGHLVVTQQILQYKFSQLKMGVSESELDFYRKGTSPQNWKNNPQEDEIKQIKKLLLQQPEQLLVDYQAGKFNEFTSYLTSSGIVLNSIEDVIPFNNYHEGIHIGLILALRKFI